ncbi:MULTISPECIES: hypothetical protein [unclassified Duganella]|uniref:hypothetical protein n=1 Tax=unclassified Duganella TaxID=2636909 RepID=UPI000873B0BA|nr:MULTISPECIES: hypothetical protein [unclassified Duganella]OEZ56309.1 hypothetical protein DUGA6_50890 [Duganella sp. HH105]OEZ99910.1 hypothetical protein DUGA2_50800 [Duganella sp. HH101]
MRKILIVLTSLLLTACVDDTASYYADGSTGNHALTLHRAQKHFWSKNSSVELIMQRLPECLRRIELTEMPADEVEIELLSGGDNVWTLRAGKEMWQVETQSCTQYPDVKGDGGELIGVFRVDGNKLVFEAAVLEPAGSDTTAPSK